MMEQPPQTTRPLHPVVQALESGTFLKLMEETLIPAEWRVAKDNGFWWIPHRLRHDIDLVSIGNDPQDAAVSCRSTFLLCVDVEDDVNGVNMCDYINQRGLGGAAWFDLDDRSIKFTSSVRLEPANWFAALNFHGTVPRLVGQLERFAPTLADLVNGKVPDTAHPTLGRRETPDQFLTETLLATIQPETACGLWWSRREIEAFRRALRFQVQAAGDHDIADQIDPVDYDDDLTSAGNLSSELVWRSKDAGSWSSLTIQEARHPEYGYGVELILGTSLLFGDDPELDERPTSPWLALTIANFMNTQQHHTCSARFGMGAWMTWRGQLVHETFLYPELVSIMQLLAGDHVGEVLAILAGQTMDHSRMLWGSYEDICESAGDPFHLPETRWGGVKNNAGLTPIFGAADELYRDMYSTYGLNRLIDPVDLGRDGFELATETTLATFGIFNPGGPSVGSIEVAINYRIGAALLLERLRHPHAPTTRVHAVLDRDGFNHLDRLVEGMVARLEWSSFDWWDIRTSFESDAEAMYRGLRRFAEAQIDDRIERLTLGLIEAVDDPWVRVDHQFVPSIDAADDANLIDLWIEVLTHPRNIDGHYAFIRSAWEGATAWLASARDGSDGGVAAQAAADRLRFNIWRRRGQAPQV